MGEYRADLHAVFIAYGVYDSYLKLGRNGLRKERDLMERPLSLWKVIKRLIEVMLRKVGHS
jgi:hypothetical protein